MSINQYILEAFSPLLQKSAFAKTAAESLIVTLGQKHLVDITKEKITLLNKIDLLSKILTSSDKTQIIEIAKIKDFLKELEPNFIRLNHVGISYFCDEPEKEIKKYQQELLKMGINIYEEKAENTSEKWFFIGDINNREAPLCEFVLNASQYEGYKKWTPAFQVDIDTSFTLEQLEKISGEHFGDNFWKWRLAIPNYGVVLVMAILGEINGTKITLGVGTDLRNTKYHRDTLKSITYS